jgi:glucokinase
VTQGGTPAGTRADETPAGAVPREAPAGHGAVPAAPVLGLDLGGSSIKWVTMAGGAVIRKGRVPTPHTGVDDVLGALAGVAAEVPETAAIGVAVAGAVDPVAGRLLVVPNIAGAWAERAVGPELAAATGRPINLANDARAFAYGQLRHGAAAGAADALFVTLGTGIGGAVAADGELRMGRARLGGEIGHMPIEPADGRKCGCGAIGCLETIAGGRALAELGADLVRAGAAPALADAVAGRPEAVEPRDVVRLANVEPDCARLVARAGNALGVALACVTNTMAPEVIVFGGGVAAGLSAFRPYIDEVLTRYCVLVECPHIVVALDDFAGAIGAAAWADRPPAGYPAPIGPGGRPAAGRPVW